MKLLTFHVTCVHTNEHHRRYAPHAYSRCVEGIPSLNSLALIMDHSHIHLVWGSQGITLKYCR